MKTINKINQILKQATKTSVPTLTALVLLAACSNDKDLNDYRAKQEQINAAKYQQAASTYNGSIDSLQDRSLIGNMSMTLSAGSVTQVSQDGLQNEKRATMRIALTISGYLNGTVATNGCDYDPGTGQLDATIPVQDEAGRTVNIIVEGNVKGGTFTGTVVTDLYKDFGGYAVLTSGATVEKASVDSSSVRILQLATDNAKFAATVTGTSGKKVPLQLVITEPGSGPEQTFLRMINPVRPVAASLSVAKTAIGFSFPVASTTIDDNNGKLTGESTPSASGNYISSLDCRKDNQLKVQVTGWTCNIDTQLLKLKNVHFTPAQ